MNRSTILDTAKTYVTKDRAATHGEAESNFALIGALWTADLGIHINATDVARLMVLFKMARAKGNPGNSENWIDAAGYAACGGEIAAMQMAEPVATLNVKNCPKCGGVEWAFHECGGEIATGEGK